MYPGSPAQIVIGLLIVLIDLLIVLRVTPYRDIADDYLSFCTGFQMLMTLLGGLLIKTDDPSERNFNVVSIGSLLVAINSMGFVMLAFSLLSLHPKVRAKLNACLCQPGKEADTKVTPAKILEQEDAVAPMTKTEATRIRQWNL